MRNNMPKEDKYRVAMYCRVGNANQLSNCKKTALYFRTAQSCDFAIKAQERAVKIFAEASGYENLSSYIDNGAGGVTLERPAMSMLLKDIREGKINTVIAKDFSRIARGCSLLHNFLSEAQKHGVKVLTVHDGEYSPVARRLFDTVTSVR